MRPGTLFLLALAAALLTASAESAPSRGDPKAMVLQRADLPAGFKRTSGRYVSNAQANRESAVKKNFAALGRLRGYEAIYRRNGVRGIIYVTSRASTYKTSAGARESMAITVRGVETTREVRFRRLSLEASIGAEARLYKATVTQNKIKVDVYTVVWRSGAVNSALLGSGPAGTAKPGFVVALARRQQARVAAA